MEYRRFVVSLDSLDSLDSWPGAWLTVATALPLAAVSPARGDNFTQGMAMAQKFGTHEIVLTGDGSISNLFNTAATVTFTPPSGSANAKTVDTFYDGGNTWRARVYITETGTWQWKSSSATDPLMRELQPQYQAAGGWCPSSRDRVDAGHVM